MCGRFSLTIQEAELEKRFNAKFYSDELMKRWNVAPTQLSIVFTHSSPRTFSLFRWGLIPFWAKDKSIGNKLINAKSETLSEKPSFRTSLKSKRCLVIADSFYEWKKDGKKKIPHRIMLKDESPFAFAGLYDEWTDKESGEFVESFTIITVPANELVQPIHDRMPAILLPEDEEKWLDSGLSQNEHLKLLNPFPAGEMKTYTVSQLVNSPANDRPEVAEEVEY